MQHIVYVIKRATKKSAQKNNLNKFAFNLEKDAKQFFADMVRDGEAGDIVTRAINKDLIEIKFIK